MPDIVVSKIVVFPIKSLDGVEVQEAAFLPTGGLEHDREFALYDEAGRWMNGKRDARIHTIRSEYNLDRLTVKLKSPTHSNWHTFHLVDNQSEIESWFTDIFGIPIFLRRDQSAGFPDDSYAKGPTIISTGTILEVGAWFAISDVSETRRRFRTNIEVSADSPFWEDQLFGPPRQEIGFRLGEVELFGVGPCKRCAVPIRNSLTGEEIPNFQDIFNTKRVATLPPWSNRARFGPLYYRLAINTRVQDSYGGKHIKIGDKFQLSVAR